jgi:tungstate transport system substrate-binding protein
MATTTSTENSGLLKYLLPKFEQKTGINMKVIAVGSGKAMKMGEMGDVDVLLVHARKMEDEFVAAGYGVNRRDVMYNDFIVVGPANDPANLKGGRTSSPDSRSWLAAAASSSRAVTIPAPT